MAAQKHTPGEWVIETETKGFEICTMHGVERQPTEDGLGQSWVYVRPASLFRDGEWHWPDEAEQMANARLIAAAPDMLAALVAIKNDPTTRSVMNSPLWHKLTSAIERAEGREP